MAKQTRAKGNEHSAPHAAGTDAKADSREAPSKAATPADNALDAQEGANADGRKAPHSSVPASSKAGAAKADSRAAPAFQALVPGALQTQVSKLTVDPGYRKVAEMLDDWESGCDCEGGSIPLPTQQSYSQALMTYSLDPALKVLAPAIVVIMGNCCTTPATITPGGEVNNLIKRLTLDPGARRLGSCIDGMHAECCGEV